MNLHEKKRKEPNYNYKLARNIKSKLYQAFKAQILEKPDKTIVLIGCSDFFKGEVFLNCMVI